MQNPLFAPTLAAGLVVCSSMAFAVSPEATQGVSANSTTSFAALADSAGPVGFLLGAVSGALMAGQNRLAQDVERNLALTYRRQGHLEESLEDMNAMGEAAEPATQALGVQVLFAAGDDRLSEPDRERIQVLAGYLVRRPQLVVEIDGYADPRGSDEYNHVLSLERARSVAYTLETLGVEPGRIQVRGHGADLSRATKGDLAAYAQERRVHIAILTPESHVLAQRAY